MLKRIEAEPDQFVVLTDDASLARSLQGREPVIGLAGPMPDFDFWHGVLYLAEEEDGVDQDYLRLVYCRFYHSPYRICECERFWIREMCETDAEAVWALHREEEIQRFLPFPAHSVEEARDVIRAYVHEVYEAGRPGIWIIEGEDGLIGRVGVEEGYLGYAVRAANRRLLIAEEACRMVLRYVHLHYETEVVYVRIHTQNEASLRLAGKLGFALSRREGDEVVLSLAVPEWLAAQTAFHPTSSE